MAKIKVEGRKSLGGGRLTKSVSVRGAQGKDRSFAQVLNLGTDYRILFPLWESEENPGTFDPEIVVCTLPVRKLNFEITGYTMYVLEDFEEAQDGTVKDLTNMEKYSRVSSVLHDAEYRVELNRKKKELEDEASQLETEVDESTMKETIKAVRKKYYGDEDKSIDPSKREFAEVNKAISGVMLEITTRVLVIPMADGKPKFSEMVSAQLSLSSRKAAQLTTLLKNSDYFFDNTRPFFEVGFSYVGASKKLAGQSASFQGISADTSLEKKAPADWKANIMTLNNIIRDPETIAAKNYNISTSPSEEAVISSLMKYIANKKVLLVNLDFESNSMKYGAKPLYELGLLDSVPKVKESVAQYIKENLESDVPENTEDAAPTEADTEIPDGVADNVGVEKLTQLDVEQLEGNLANIDNI